jgi:hypothetical protein
MTEEDPVRLASTTAEDGAARSLRSLIDHGRKELPSDTQLAALAAKLAPILGGGGGGGGGGTGTAKPAAVTAAKVTSTAVAKGVAIAAVSVGALATVWQVMTTPNPSDGAPARPAPTVSAPLTAASAGVDPQAAPGPAGALPDPSSSPITLSMPTFLPRTAPSPPARIPRNEAGAPTPEVQNELRLLQSATKAIQDDDPKKALAICDQAAASYPDGVLAQEREALAIRALVSLGRADDANARAAAFRAKYPNSAHTPRIDQILSAH